MRLLLYLTDLDWCEVHGKGQHKGDVGKHEQIKVLKVNAGGGGGGTRCLLVYATFVTSKRPVRSTVGGNPS